MRAIPLLPLLALGALAASSGAVAACATNPVTGEREFTLMTEAQEIAMGRESDAQVRAEMGVYDDPELTKYVSDIGLKLAKLSERPNLPWQFTVVDQAAINAFALPGGFIYVTRGILPFLDNEAELAGVLGHEIGHVTARHSVRQYRDHRRRRRDRRAGRFHTRRASLQSDLGAGAWSPLPEVRPREQYVRNQCATNEPGAAAARPLRSEARVDQAS